MPVSRYDVDADDVQHFCALCKTVTSGHYGLVRSFGLETDVFICHECSTATHSDCEE